MAYNISLQRSARAESGKADFPTTLEHRVILHPRDISKSTMGSYQ